MTILLRYGHAADFFFTPRAHVNHVYMRTSNSTCAHKRGSRAHVNVVVRTWSEKKSAA